MFIYSLIKCQSNQFHLACSLFIRQGDDLCKLTNLCLWHLYNVCFLFSINSFIIWYKHNDFITIINTNNIKCTTKSMASFTQHISNLMSLKNISTHRFSKWINHHLTIDLVDICYWITSPCIITSYWNWTSMYLVFCYGIWDS